jgi:hypothetical protein
MDILTCFGFAKQFQKVKAVVSCQKMMAVLKNMTIVIDMSLPFLHLLVCIEEMR